MMPDDGDMMMPDPPPMTATPVVGIFTANNAMAMEGGQIALTLSVTSGTVPTGGLTVTLNIGVAEAAEFTTTPASVCTNLVCVITIPQGATMATLTLMPTSDSATETAEDWTATLVDGENYDLDNTMDNFVAFQITDPTPPPVVVPLPTPSSDRTLAELNAYDTPTNLAADEIRAGEDATIVGDITGFRYDDADGNLRVLVEKLDFAHLGLWITGDIVDNDFDYATLDNNVVMLAADFSGLSTAIYNWEGDITYKGVRFYPDGNFTMNFAAGTFTGNFLLQGGSPANHFGDANAMLPDGMGGMRPVTADNVTTADILSGGFLGTTITADGFSGSIQFVNPTGFFSDIPGGTALPNALNGRFHHGNDYVMGTTTPTEISGTFTGITDSNGMELKGGFLGQCTTGC